MLADLADEKHEDHDDVKVDIKAEVS